MNANSSFTVEKSFTGVKEEFGLSPVNPHSQIPLITGVTEYSCVSVMGCLITGGRW